MYNYFYDILSEDLQNYVLEIAEELNKKDIISKVYVPWVTRNHNWVHSYEEYRHIQTRNGDIWYVDCLIEYPNCGGLSTLKLNESVYQNIITIYQTCKIIDEIRFLKLCKHTTVKQSINKDIWDLDCDVYVGNWWENGYTSPLIEHLDMANEMYDDRVEW